MRTQLNKIGVAVGLLAAGLVTLAAQGQAPAPPAPGTAAPAVNTVVENPSYVSLHLEVDVNRPAADVWKRVGGYCAIGEWFQIAAGCKKILSGSEGEVGAVRSVANEVMVAKTEFSYTYAQPVRAGRPYNVSHRHTRGSARNRDNLEAAVHADVGQLDAGRRGGARERQGVANGHVHAGAPEHEDARRRRHARAAVRGWMRRRPLRPDNRERGKR